MKKGSFLITAGLLMILAALCITGFNIYSTVRARAASAAVLEELTPAVPQDPPPPEGRRIQHEDIGIPDEIEYPDYIVNPEMDMPLEEIDGIDYIGVLEIPALELSLPVAADWDYYRLNKSPCRYVGSAYLHDLVICAHNYDIHFGNIKTLSYGDKIIFTDMAGNVFTYDVIEIETLQPTAIDQMITGDWDLTLFTCTIGGATRVTVRCVLQ